MLSTSGPGVVRVGESLLFVANGRNTNEQDHRQADFRFHQVPLPPLGHARCLSIFAVKSIRLHVGSVQSKVISLLAKSRIGDGDNWT